MRIGGVMKKIGKMIESMGFFFRKHESEFFKFSKSMKSILVRDGKTGQSNPFWFGPPVAR